MEEQPEITMVDLIAVAVAVHARPSGRWIACACGCFAARCAACGHSFPEHTPGCSSPSVEAPEVVDMVAEILSPGAQA